MNFAEAVGQVIPSKFIAEKGGLSYIGWATLVGLSGRAAQKVATFDERPVLRVFDGAVVAVDMQVADKTQRTWLPVLDNRNTAIPLAKVDTRDISDTINRCRAKAIAMVTGHGLSMYAGYKGNGKKFLADLGVTPGCDLAQAVALVSKKGNAEYLDWASALAAARVADPTFVWEVLDFPVKTEAGVEPTALRQLSLAIAGGYMVGIKVTYKGETHVEYLPIMDVNFKPQAKPTVADWNKTIMRALAKATAVATGYGLSIYAKESLLTPVATHAEAEARKENLGALVPNAGEPPVSQRELPVDETPAAGQDVAATVEEVDGVSKVARDLVVQILATVKAALSAKRIQDARNFLAGSQLTDPEKAYGNEALDALAKSLVPENTVTADAPISDEARELVSQIIKTVQASLSEKRIQDARNYLAGSKLTDAEKAYGNEGLDKLANSLIEEKAA